MFKLLHLFLHQGNSLLRNFPSVSFPRDVPAISFSQILQNLNLTCNLIFFLVQSQENKEIWLDTSLCAPEKLFIIKVVLSDLSTQRLPGCQQPMPQPTKPTSSYPRDPQHHRKQGALLCYIPRPCSFSQDHARCFLAITSRRNSQELGRLLAVLTGTIRKRYSSCNFKTFC